MAREAPGGIVTAELFNELVREFNSLRNLDIKAPLTGGVFAGGIAIGLNRRFLEKLPQSGSIDALTVARVLYSEPTWAVGVEPDGVNVQWRYAVQLITFDGSTVVPEDGYNGVWQIDPEANQPSYWAYNLLEVKNSRLTPSDMVMGNGVDLQRLQTNFPNQRPQPAPVDALLLCFLSGGFWWFMYENPIDGEC